MSGFEKKKNHPEQTRFFFKIKENINNLNKIKEVKLDETFFNKIKQFERIYQFQLIIRENIYIDKRHWRV